MDLNQPATIAALGLLALAAASFAGLAVGTAVRGLRGRLLLAAVVLATFVFQGAHLQEHGAQAVYWLGHPGEAPWLTPWAGWLAGGLADVCGATMVAPGGRLETRCGVELLHLAGNSVFLAGALALLVLSRRATAGRSPSSVRWLAGVQGFHVLEHVLLTATLVLSGRPLGFSTLFGITPEGAGLDAYRVWWHFGVNLAASVLAIVAIRDLVVSRRRPAAALPLAAVPSRRVTASLGLIALALITSPVAAVFLAQA